MAGGEVVDLRYSRAIEAVLWGMPIVSFDAMRQAYFRDAGADYGDIVYWSRPSDASFQFVTLNASAYYVLVRPDRAAQRGRLGRRPLRPAGSGRSGIELDLHRARTAVVHLLPPLPTRPRAVRQDLDTAGDRTHPLVMRRHDRRARRGQHVAHERGRSRRQGSAPPAA